MWSVYDDERLEAMPIRMHFINFTKPHLGHMPPLRIIRQKSKTTMDTTFIINAYNVNGYCHNSGKRSLLLKSAFGTHVSLL